MNRWLIVLLLSACSGPSPEKTSEKLDRFVERSIGKKGVRHAVLHVDAPALGVAGTWVHGDADAAGTPMTAELPFLSASIGKLFTAVTVTLLAREGRLDLDDPVTDWLDVDVVEGLPFPVPAEQVRIADLLAHTSGLPDSFVGETTDGTPTVFEQWQSEPDRAWTRDALIAHTRDHQVSAGELGSFTYSDTNYDLLGLVIERAAEAEDFQDVVGARILEPLGLSATAYHHRVDGTVLDASWADAWIDDVPIAHSASLSGDLAGGGLITTTSDLVVFLRALADGTLGVTFDDLAASTTEDAMSRGMDYGHGLWTIRPARVSFMLRGVPELHGASGSTGSFAYYVPDWDAVITGTFDQTNWEERHLRWLLTNVLPRLNQLSKE